MSDKNKEAAGIPEEIEKDITDNNPSGEVSSVILEDKVNQEDQVVKDDSVNSEQKEFTNDPIANNENESVVIDELHGEEAAAAIENLDGEVNSDGPSYEDVEALDDLLKASSEDIVSKDIPVDEDDQSDQVDEDDQADEDGSKEKYDDIDYKRLESLSDDEAVIELDKLTGQNDEIVERDYLSSLVSQDDRLVYYEIENIYSNEEARAFKNRLKMRRDPPVLVVKDDFGNQAKFYLTENLTDELTETLRQVKRAYHGFNNPSDMNMPEKFVDRVKYYIKNNPFKVSATVFLILFAISFLF